MAKILIDIPQETYDYIMSLYAINIPKVETRSIQYTVINAIRQGKVVKEQEVNIEDSNPNTNNPRS